MSATSTSNRGGTVAFVRNTIRKGLEKFVTVLSHVGESEQDSSSHSVPLIRFLFLLPPPHVVEHIDHGPHVEREGETDSFLVVVGVVGVPSFESTNNRSKRGPPARTEERRLSKTASLRHAPNRKDKQGKLVRQRGFACLEGNGVRPPEGPTRTTRNSTVYLYSSASDKYSCALLRAGMKVYW